MAEELKIGCQEAKQQVCTESNLQRNAYPAVHGIVYITGWGTTYDLSVSIIPS